MPFSARSSMVLAHVSPWQSPRRATRTCTSVQSSRWPQPRPANGSSSRPSMPWSASSGRCRAWKWWVPLAGGSTTAEHGRIPGRSGQGRIGCSPGSRLPQPSASSRYDRDRGRGRLRRSRGARSRRGTARGCGTGPAAPGRGDLRHLRSVRPGDRRRQARTITCDAALRGSRAAAEAGRLGWDLRAWRDFGCSLRLANAPAPARPPSAASPSVRFLTRPSNATGRGLPPSLLSARSGSMASPRAAICRSATATRSRCCRRCRAGERREGSQVPCRAGLSPSSSPRRSGRFRRSVRAASRRRRRQWSSWLRRRSWWPSRTGCEARGTSRDGRA